MKLGNIQKRVGEYIKAPELHHAADLQATLIQQQLQAI